MQYNKYKIHCSNTNALQLGLSCPITPMPMKQNASANSLPEFIPSILQHA